ncbi:diphthamide synthesis protein [Candidatus Woesearchaeota archaeon]|nr:diphthamide synthesis protein [Candidatus Woesearchaeota archaeon]
MKVLFLDAPYTGKVELCKKTIDFLKKNKVKNTALYASVQFVNKLEKVKEQLKKLKIKITTSKAARTHVESQLLGCVSYHESLNLSDLSKIDYFLYIGDGKFHPYALMYAQKEIICNDPMTESMNLITQEDLKSIINRYNASLKKFLASDTIGTITTVKPGQEQLFTALELEKRYINKKFYHFIDNNVSFDQLENFPFIDIWINTACPRIGTDDQEKFIKGVININDALNAEKILSK